MNRPLTHLIQEDLSKQGEKSFPILQLLPKRLRREPRRVRKQPAEQGNVDCILHAPEVDASEGGERRITRPVDALQILLLDGHLNQQVRCRCLDGRDPYAKCQGLRMSTVAINQEEVLDPILCRPSNAVEVSVSFRLDARPQRTSTQLNSTHMLD